MSETSRLSLSQISHLVQERIAPVLTFLYLLLAMMVFLVAPILFFVSARAPFIGSFYEHTLMLNTSQPTRPGAWGDQLRLPFGYQIVALNDARITSTLEWRLELENYQVGDTATLTLRNPEGELETRDITLMKLPFIDQVSYFVVPYLIGLVYLLSGLYVFGVRRYDPAGRAFALFTGAVSIALASLYDLYSTNYLVTIWTISLAISAGALFNLALLFPESVRQVVRYPFLGWVGYGVAILMALYAWSTLYDYARPTAYVVAWRFEFVYMGLAVIFFLAMIAIRRLTASSPVVREQARFIFWGALISFTPLGIWFFVTTANPSVLFSSLFLLPMGIFPVFTGYAIIRYRLLSTDYMLSRGVLYAFMTGLAVAGYALLVGGLGLVFGDVLRPTSPILVGLMVFLLAVGLNPLRAYLQGVIDRYFFRGQVVYRGMQQAFGHELTQQMELVEIVGLLRRYVEQALSPAQLHIYVYDPLSAHYAASSDAHGTITSDVHFPMNSALVQVLSRQREALFLADLGDLPDTLQLDKARLALLGAQLFVPLPGRQQLIGWLALGARRSGEPYASRDLRFLEVLSDQTALAVERAQVVADLERRVREMNVLTRVAQGASFTMIFDDILELISAQASQILPARDFRVTLRDEETEILTHAFYLEDDERLEQYENKPLPIGQGLEEEVVKSQRPLITDDYERECRGRGLLPSARGIYAWMGVPLNAGAQTIGLISVGSRDPAVIYTVEQRDLLQAIADQASGAIVKARLLEESERRARQLAMLNEISLGLTSTLDVKLLLNQILQNATEILNCEAGSLFLVDNETGELVFEVVLGPVAANLLGRRLPPGTGLVGEAVRSGQPIIANDAKRRKAHYDQTDIQTGFDTQDLLVVPMRVQDRVIGVIEVINKVNGAPFTQDDQELLTAFTSQATIAVENARLYTMTDQALAARVEELSVMQRIDRELNASLDIERAMRITLEWAMRQSRAEAGLLGAVDETGVQVMTAQGYTDDLGESRPSADGKTQYLPAYLVGVRQAVESGLPQRLLESDRYAAGGDRFALLTGGSLQIVIPIRRETTTIGILLLESTQAEDCPDELISFLTRLSDHAAIAIANAQLYEEVMDANLAKSRFVSFVAHELKNPMASIKGYTELISGGMAGPVSEMQSSFLSTIHSNVDRMNTIVTDLNDLTKIQVGNLRLDYKGVQIEEVLEDVIRSLRKQIDEKMQRLVIEIPGDMPAVWADASRLAQVLTNLVSNAHKYTPESGEIFISAEHFTPKEDDSMAGVEFVHLWVQDTGIGISEEDQMQIFQQYFRTESAREMASGTGLGLSITKSLIELQGGRIWFNSRQGEGATFHILMPIAEAQ
ncbi:MAG: GAF domain-containing protein [Anaerolineales bacterium]|nr:GAF domain-containing protein [Anaerolineales bacterium]